MPAKTRGKTEGFDLFGAAGVECSDDVALFLGIEAR
jgi:hypothetical protein